MSPEPKNLTTPGYAILRTQKLKAAQAIRRSLMHGFRDMNTPNADPERTPDNAHIGASSTQEALDKFNNRLETQKHVRKNGVLAIEYLMTGSPEAMAAMDRKAQDAYFEDALKWLQKRHGEENVFYAGIHRDESTPHMYAYVVPIDEKGKLNCSAYLGNARALSAMQTDYANAVGSKYGLIRGIEGSKAKHERVKRHYAVISQKNEVKTSWSGKVSKSDYDEISNALDSYRQRERQMQAREVLIAEKEKKQKALDDALQLERNMLETHHLKVKQLESAKLDLQQRLEATERNLEQYKGFRDELLEENDQLRQRLDGRGYDL